MGRRGFNLVEMLLATAITATLLVAVMVSLDVSYKAYRATTESTSTSMAGRVIMERLQGLIRNGIDFAPLPGSFSGATLESSYLDIQRPDGTWVTIAWDAATSSITWSEDGGTYTVLEGVTQLPEGAMGVVSPFVLEYHLGRHLHRATIDLSVVADVGQHLDIEGDSQFIHRLVGSAMPRNAAWSN